MPNRRALGGVYNERGSQYRTEAAILLAAQLLSLGEDAYLEIEGLEGEDLLFFDGLVIRTIETKNHYPGDGTGWTWASLAKEDIDDWFVGQYQKYKSMGDDKKFEIVLMSSDGAATLSRYCDDAQRGALTQEHLEALQGKFALPEGVEINEYFKHIKVATVSRFAEQFLLGPQALIILDPILREGLRNFIVDKGFDNRKITKNLLSKEVPAAKQYLSAKSIATDVEKDKSIVARFYRKFVPIDSVKAVLDDLKRKRLSERSVFEREIERYLNYYDTNIKIVLSVLDLFKYLDPPTDEDARSLVANISGNPLYQWHFFKGLSHARWFELIKSSLIKDICQNDEPLSVKNLVIDYIFRFIRSNLNDVLSLSYDLVTHSKDYNLLRRLAEKLAEVNVDHPMIWTIMEVLSVEKHSWVREEVAKTIGKIAHLNYEKALDTLKRVLYSKSDPQDMVTGSLTMSMRFQGRDLENGAFEEAMKTLGKLLNEYPEQTFKFACELLQSYILQERPTTFSVRGNSILSDLSYVWYSQSDIAHREYEYDRKERVALELEASLSHFAVSSPEKLESLARIIIAKRFEIFFLILLKVLPKVSTVLPIVKSLVMRKQIWKNFALRTGYFQDVISHFSHIPEYARTFRLYEAVVSSSSILDAETKEDLLLPLRDQRIRFNRAVGPIVESDFHEESIDLSDFSIGDILSIVKGENASFQIDHWKLRSTLIKLGSTDPSKGFDLLKLMSADQSTSSQLVGELVDGILEGWKDKVADVIQLPEFLRNNDRWGALSIARYFQDKCRDANDIPTEYRSKLISALSKLLQVNDRGRGERSLDDERALDLATEGLNKHRGVVGIALIYYAFHFPSSTRVFRLIRQLALGTDYATQSIIIMNMRWLVRYPKYDTLTKEILNQYHQDRMSGIDGAILEFIVHLNMEKFAEYQEWIPVLLRSKNKEILGRLGEMIGARFMSGGGLTGAIETVISNQDDYAEVRRGIAFQLESDYPKAYSGELSVTKNDVLTYLKRLIDPKYERNLEVRNRAAFVFARDSLPAVSIRDFLQFGFFEAMGNDPQNVHAQHYVLKYIDGAASEYPTEAISAFTQMIKKDFPILDDYLSVGEMVKIIRIGFEKKTEIGDTLFENVQIIFDLLLEKGWDEASVFFRELIPTA